MSEMLCIHDGEQHVGNICVPGPQVYYVAVRRPYQKYFRPVGEAHDTITEAMQTLIEAMEHSRWLGNPYSKAGIWAADREPSYYEPHQIYEVTTP